MYNIYTLDTDLRMYNDHFLYMVYVMQVKYGNKYYNIYIYIFTFVCDKISHHKQFIDKSND